MKLKLGVLFFLILLVIGCSLDVEENPEIITKDDNTYQFSTKENLLNREYYKTNTLYKLDEKGDFGIGTLNGVDGELIILDGKYYQVKYTGHVANPVKSSLCPFANIKFFEADNSLIIKNSDKDNTLSLIKYKNSAEKIAAVKVEGYFNFVQARSVEKVDGTEKSLDQIIADQAVFNFDKIKGTLVGYYIPDKYNVECFAGFHFHFVSDNFQLGGHVLDFEIDSAKAFIDLSDSLKIVN